MTTHSVVFVDDLSHALMPQLHQRIRSRDPLLRRLLHFLLQLMLKSHHTVTQLSIANVTSATHDQETCTRNLCKSSGTRNLHVCRSILYKLFSGTSFLHAIEHSCIYSITETAQHVTRTVQRDWPCSRFCARNRDELVSNFLCKFLVQVFERVSLHNNGSKR